MHVDEQGIKKLLSILGQLSDQIYLFTHQGKVIKGPMAGEVKFPESLPQGGVFSFGTNLFYQSEENPEFVFACNQSVQGGANILILASNLAKSILNQPTSIENVYDVYRRILREEIYGQDVLMIAKEYQIPVEMERGAFVFYIDRIEKQDCFSLLKDIVPQNEDDVLIEMSKHTVVLLQNLKELKTQEEVFQFAEALQETIVTEMGIEVTIGIGNRMKQVEGLGISYRQGKKSVEIGRIFQKKASVFLYEKMILERFMAELPVELTRKYPEMIFNRKTARLFNDEMLQTIEMFFEKDLNLSDTARQLYIHRNTLVYRLDKVQRVMGLDLRKFQDAVTFKLLLEMRKGANEIFYKERV